MVFQTVVVVMYGHDLEWEWITGKYGCVFVSECSMVDVVTIAIQGMWVCGYEVYMTGWGTPYIVSVA